MARRARSFFLRNRHGGRLWRLGVLLAVASVTGGCASINHFAVTPRAVCRGDTVKAAWSAKGRVKLTSRPALKGTGEQPSVGEKSFVVDRPTRFVLHATRSFGSSTAEADVNVASQQHSYAAVAQCSVGDRLITSRVVLGHQLSEKFRVDAVGNPLDRPLRVSKNGHTASIAAYGQSDAFRGETARGTWRLASPLKTGETCASAMQALRQRLEMQLKLQCGG